MTREPTEPSLELPWAEPPHPGEAVTRRIREHCLHELAPAVGPTARARFLGSALLSISVFLLLFVLSRAWAKPPELLRAALFGAAGWGLIMAAVLALGLVRPPGRRGPRALRLGLALGLPLCFLAYLLVIGVPAPWAEFAGAGATHALTCGLGALLVGAVTSAGVLWLWRGTDPFTPRLTGALAGLVGGMTSAVAIGTACPSGETYHLCLSHGSVVVAFALAGALAGRRWLAP